MKKKSIIRQMHELGMYFLRGTFELVRTGMREHRQGLKIVLPIIFIAVIVIGYGFLKFSETAFFCGSCHNMKPYVDSWKNSSHKNASCIDCHYKPGFIEHMKGKWRDGQVSLIYVISGKRPPRFHAQVDDASCLQSKCHAKADLKQKVIYRNVTFDHVKHLDELKREKKLRCTTCHSQIVQGEHMTVTKEVCFTCHFYKTKEDKEYVTPCTACHFEAKGDLKAGDFTWDHKNYIKRGISCDKCHTNVVIGDGKIKEHTCIQCHEKREYTETVYKPEMLHRYHVTEHKVECHRCHNLIKHEITMPKFTEESFSGECMTCHKGQQHEDIAKMYLGKGAKFIEDVPNRKATLKMGCSMCHEVGKDKSDIIGKCRSCHGNLTDGMVDRWKRHLAEKQAELFKEIMAVKPLAEGKLKSKWNDAMYNYAFLQKGNGTHNIIYAMRIIEATKNVLGEIRAKASNTVTSYKEFKLSCTYICHGDISSKRIPFGKSFFHHDVHVENDDDCGKCHTKYNNHGKTIMKNCKTCHHENQLGTVSCTDCHKQEADMFAGRGIKGIKETKSPMFGKSCTTCHPAGNPNIQHVKNSCKKCHKQSMDKKVDEWINFNRTQTSKYLVDLAMIEKDLEVEEKREGGHSVPLRAMYEELAEEVKALSLGGFNHNPVYSKMIVEKIDKNMANLKKMIADKLAGKKVLIHQQ